MIIETSLDLNRTYDYVLKRIYRELQRIIHNKTYFKQIMSLWTEQKTELERAQHYILGVLARKFCKVIYFRRNALSKIICAAY